MFCCWIIELQNSTPNEAVAQKTLSCSEICMGEGCLVHGVKLFEVNDESLPWQICIIVAITNAIITGVGVQNRGRG